MNFYSIEKEIALGKQMAQEVERQARLVDDPLAAEYVNRLGQNLANNSDARVLFTVIRQMKDPESGATFLTSLLTEELGPQQPSPDAVIVISPMLSLDRGPSQDQISKQIHVQCPVFFLNYNPDPVENPWGARYGTYSGRRTTHSFLRSRSLATLAPPCRICDRA